MKFNSFSRMAAGCRLPLLLAVGLVLSACSLTGPPPSSTSPQSVAPGASPSPATVQGSTGGPNTAQGQPAPTGQNGLPVLDYRDGFDDSTPVRVELNDVRVRGQILWVTLTARNTSTGSDSWQIADFFGPSSALDASGIYLVDSVRAKRYLPGENPDGRCLCSTNLGTVFVDPGQGALITVAFAAPPPEVTDLELWMPGLQPFVGVRPGR